MFKIAFNIFALATLLITGCANAYSVSVMNLWPHPIKATINVVAGSAKSAVIEPDKTHEFSTGIFIPESIDVSDAIYPKKLTAKTKVNFTLGQGYSDFVIDADGNIKALTPNEFMHYMTAHSSIAAEIAEYQKRYPGLLDYFGLADQKKIVQAMTADTKKLLDETVKIQKGLVARIFKNIMMGFKLLGIETYLPHGKNVLQKEKADMIFIDSWNNDKGMFEGSRKEIDFYSPDNANEAIRNYKIHLMPERKNIIKVVMKLIDALSKNKINPQDINQFKFFLPFSTGTNDDKDRNGNQLPYIVIYPAGSKEAASRVACAIEVLLKNENPSGLEPRFNVSFGQSKLIFYAQGDADFKSTDRSYFSSKYNFAVFNDTWIPGRKAESYLLDPAGCKG